MKKRIIIPIVKKREGVKVETCRGVTFMSTLYKVYMEVLAERVRN